MITVIVTRSDHADASAWKTTGADLREYEGQAVSERERETRIDAEVRAACEEYAEEEAEAAEAEIAEQTRRSTCR